MTTLILLLIELTCQLFGIGERLRPGSYHGWSSALIAVGAEVDEFKAPAERGEMLFVSRPRTDWLLHF